MRETPLPRREAIPKHTFTIKAQARLTLHMLLTHGALRPLRKTLIPGPQRMKDALAIPASISRTLIGPPAGVTFALEPREAFVQRTRFIPTHTSAAPARAAGAIPVLFARVAFSLARAVVDGAA